VSNGSWSPTPDSFTYVWKRGNAVIFGVTSSTYVLQPADAGSKITVVQTAVKAGFASTSTIRTTAVVTSEFDEASIPSIGGVAQVGQTLQANVGTWVPVATAYRYQWKRDGANIPRATSSSYVLTASDLNKEITVAVTGIRSGYAPTTQLSENTDPVFEGFFASAPRPTVAGRAKVGQLLTAQTGRWLPSASISYQWLRDGEPIAGATNSNYRLVQADLAAAVSVKVTANRSGYRATPSSSRDVGPVVQSLSFGGSTPIAQYIYQTVALTDKVASYIDIPVADGATVVHDSRTHSFDGSEKGFWLGPIAAR
jgi:hypothetical protein